MIKYSNCPACSSPDILPVLEVKDFTVSHERFSIFQCKDCSLRFTQDVPDSTDMGRYYQSVEYISHSNTAKGVVNMLYHQVRKFTIRHKKKMVLSNSNFKSGVLLDMGAGTGVFAAAMKKAGWKVIGLEPDTTAKKNALETYQLKLEDPSLLFSLEENSIDVVTMWHVLEHVHTLQQYLQQIKKITKKGGLILVAVPNYTSHDAGKYGPFWAAYDVPRHLYHFSPLAMEQLLHLHGLKLSAIKPMWFDSFYVSLLSEQYKTGKQQLVKGFVHGLLSNMSTLKDVKMCSSLVYVVKVP